MRLAVAVLAAIVSLAAATGASAQTPRSCTRASGDYEGGPNSFMMWTRPDGAGAGYTYQDAGLTCLPAPHYRRHRHHVANRSRSRAHKTYARAGWINIPLENRGGLCPKGDCDLYNNGARKYPA